MTQYNKNDGEYLKAKNNIQMNDKDKVNNQVPIGVFDSGIGGITVLRELRKVLPNERFIYYSDSIHNPYGQKEDTEIIQICDNIVQYLIQRNCKMIVIACNTASAKASDYLRKKYSKIPIIAIEPACKMVHDFSIQGTATLIMATKGTIESEKFNILMNKYCDENTYILPCVGLADLIERRKNEEDDVKLQNYLERELKEYKGKVKNVVLGCTHYPLIKEQIKEVLGEVEFFDGAKGVAKHARQVLEERNLIASGKNENENDKSLVEFIGTFGDGSFLSLWDI